MSASPVVTSRPRAAFVYGGLALALGLRLALLAWASARGLVIDSEGTEYCRIAENLLAGRGFVGLFDNGAQLNFPPLYPWLIAGVSLLGPSIELAARLVNVAAGMGLIVAIWRIADRLYGRRPAWIAATLVAAYPLMIAASISTYAEVPYLTIVMFALDAVLGWLDTRRLSAAIIAGVCLGLAYLTRPEAFLLVAGLAAIALLWWLRRRERSTLVAAGVLVGLFVVFASPYVVYLTAHTGKVQLEAKGRLAYIWGQRMRAGMSYWESSNGIGEDLSNQGVFMRSNLEVLQSAAPSRMEMLRYVAWTAPRSVDTIVNYLTTAGTIGSPFLALLAVLGLVRSPWDRRRLLRECVVVGGVLVTVVALSSVQAFWLRYFYAFLGPMLLWAGKGVDEVRDWGERTAALPGRWGRAIGWTAGVALALAAVVMSLRSLRGESLVLEAMRIDRRLAGEWLAREAPGRKWIMGLTLIPPYYAGGALKFLPYANGELALRYIAKERPDYIVLEEGMKIELPYLAGWFDNGIPDARAKLVYDEGGPGRERIKIYRWVVNPP